jgi:hypothetical protein
MHVPGFGIKARTDWGKQAFSRSRARTAVTYRAAKSEIRQTFNRGSITCDSPLRVHRRLRSTLSKLRNFGGAARFKPKDAATSSYIVAALK